MESKKYTLVYSDGRHHHEYARLMSLAQAKAKVAANVKRYFKGAPSIDYLDWGGSLEVIVRYPIKDDPGRSVAHISPEV